MTQEDAMTQFLIVYDRSTGELLKLEDLGADRAEAIRRRSEIEHREMANPEIEVVVLSAPAEDVLRRTHARYFRSVDQLADALQRKAVSAATT
jgi:hypothetical protein